MFWVCLVLAFFFRSAEAAFSEISRIHLQHLADSGDIKAKKAAGIMENPGRFYALMVFCINLFKSGTAVTGTILAVTLWGENLGAALAVIILTVVMLIFAEYFPKSLAVRNGEKLALAYATTLGLIMKLLSPLLYILDHAGLKLTSLFGKVDPRPTITEDEFHALISAGHREGTVEAEQAEMLHNVFDFGSQLVREVMVPRPEVVFVEKGTILSDFLLIYKEHPQSYFPVFEESRDNIVGELRVKDILLTQAEGTCDNSKPIDPLIKSPCMAPETKPIGELLVEMQNQNKNLCIVVDEYGGTAGVVTLEQLVAEIVGPVGEELTLRQKEFEMLDDTTFQVDGGMNVGDANDEMELGLPEGDYDTVAGFVLNLLGRIPEQGERLRYNDLIIAITKMTGAKIDEILITREKNRDEAVPGET